jgi:nucleotide-binding universal stress UspA family protein
MNKRIVVPLDGSRLAEMALPHAAALARANSYSLLLLHAAPLPEALSTAAWGVSPSVEVWRGDHELAGPGAGAEHDPEQGRRYLEAVAQRLQPLNLDVHTQLAQDEPTRAIISYAEQHPEVALIAMSTHGRSGLGRLVFGSVAEQVLHSSPVPLLLVRPVQERDIFDDLQVPHYASLLVPLDGSEFAAAALDHARALAHALDASLALMSAVPEHLLGLELAPVPVVPAEWANEQEMLTSYLEQTKLRLEAEDLRVQTRLEQAPPSEAIVRVAGEVHPDLIVMATHARTGLPRFLLGSVAMKVVQASICPVLLVRTKERVEEHAFELRRAGISAGG